ncbi:valyl tRNA synthetase modifier [Escherichia phage vB_EcoM_005]|uniref:Valyl-tRNA synthetase modifier n=1 Tax=Escherichia phage vB_EcoM_005 TaxID=2500761 RepID=A0A3Q9RA07_9CAUD|nr:valyl tRNA synthetase modifier [Escherichia phage vB_EcoM_005]AZV01014.1 valyl-tRNA synthetase modifier [Escherichia phage vB_EcoM_005]
MIKQMTIALMLIAPGVLASQVDDSNNSIVEYATRTVRMKEKTLSKRYEQRLNVTECIPSDKKYKEMCASMVDRLVDSYNRGLNSK